MPNAARHFFGSLFRYARPKIGSTLALVILGALLEGAGILLLLAGLQIILGQGEGSGAGLAAFLPDEAARGGGIAAVSAGIAEALIVTAVGLIVAIFAVLVFNYLSARFDRFDMSMQHAASELVDRLEGASER